MGKTSRAKNSLEKKAIPRKRHFRSLCKAL
jgi:hypothetical protein